VGYSEPERVQVWRITGEGVPKPWKERFDDELSKFRNRRKVDLIGVKQGGTAGVDTRPCNVTSVAGTGILFFL